MYTELLSVLDRHLHAMSEAVQAEEWEAIAVLDEAFQDTLRKLVNTIPADISPSQRRILSDAVARAMDFYRDTISRCKDHRDGLQEEMISLNTARKGIKSYQIL